MKTILIAGGAGFIGSNLLNHLSRNYMYQLVNLDSLSADLSGTIKEGMENKYNYHFVSGDILDDALLEDIFSAFDIDAVVNLASVPYQKREIQETTELIRTNVQGTVKLLDTALKHWKKNTDPKDATWVQGKRFIQISTDEVYGFLGSKGYFKETQAMRPENMYAASKASADIIVRSYFDTYQMPVNILKCSRAYGPLQALHHFIPKTIVHAIKKEKFVLKNNGSMVRDWIHVKDLCRAIDKVLHDGVAGEIYNVGSGEERSIYEIAKYVYGLFDTDRSLIQLQNGDSSFAKRYVVDNTKIITRLNWAPKHRLDDGLKEMAYWYKENYGWMEEADQNAKQDNLEK